MNMWLGLWRSERISSALCHCWDFLLAGERNEAAGQNARLNPLRFLLSAAEAQAVGFSGIAQHKPNTVRAELSV